MDYHEKIEERRSEFNELVTKLSKDHQISDGKVLGRAIDFAVRMYHDNDVLSKRDSALLLKHIPEVTNVLLRPRNAERIADLLVRRDDARIRGGKHDPITHGRTFLWVTQIGKNLAELERSLKTRPRRRRTPDVGLHSAIGILSRYWQDLPAKRLTRTFTPNDKNAGRQLAKSEAMKFIEEVMNFIDPAAIRKLPSATRHRLRGIAKIDA